MAYYAAGAWWTSDGQAFGTQQAAEAAERNGGGGSAASADDEFARAMGRGGTGVQAPAGAVSAANAAAAAARQAAGVTNDARTAGNINYGGSNPYFTGARPSNYGLSLDPSTAQEAGQDQARASAAANARDGGLIGDVARLGLYGLRGGPLADLARDYKPAGIGDAFDIPGNILDELGDQIIPGGSGDQGGNIIPGVRRTGGDSFYPSETIQSGSYPDGYRGVTDSGNTGAISGLLDGVPGYPFGDNVLGPALRGIGDAVSGVWDDIRGAVGGGGGGGAGGLGGPAPPIASPQLAITPQQILSMNNQAAVPSRAQSDGIINQMIQQSQVQSPYQDFSNANYDASRGAAMGYTSQLAGLASNNIADIRPDSAQRNQSRDAVMVTASQLQNNANNNIANIYGAQGERNAAAGSVMGYEQQLTRDRSIIPNAADQATYLDSRDRAENISDQLMQQGRTDYAAREIATLRGMGSQDYNKDVINNLNTLGGQDYNADVIQRLIAQSELPDDVSAAQSLMLNAQERATRNALGNAASQGGGWRSAVNNERRALGQAATQQADIAAQMGALRAQETQMQRQNAINALTQAGGLTEQQRQGRLTALGLSGGLGDSQYANKLAAYQAAGGLLTQQEQVQLAALQQAGVLTSNFGALDAGLATSDADRKATINMANQADKRLGATAAGQLALGRQVDASNFATADANRNAQIAQANAVNRINSLLGAGGLQTGAMNSDTSFSVADAQIQLARAQSNQQNALNAMLGAANAANQTAGLDANIGVADANRRATVDQNNRANSIAALQNAGVLSTTLRGQDVQLSVSNQQALSQQIAAAAGLAGTQFASEMQRAIAQGSQDLQRQQLALLARNSPSELERFLGAAGSAAGLLGLVF